MTGSLSKDEVARYHRDGFFKPITVFSVERVKEIRLGIEAIERDFSTKNLPHDLTHYFRVNGELVIPLLAEVALSKSILDAMESILGPNFMVWSCELFIKEPQSQKIVSWHQDLTYWGMGGSDLQASTWIAISDVSETSGCMRFVPESHKQQLVPHIDTFNEDNLLSRGQEIAVEVDERDAVLNILKPGEMSIHHGRMFHASGPNLSKDRRIAIVIRYVTPELVRDAPGSDFAMLVRGKDSCKNWINVAPPSTLFGQGEMNLYDEIIKYKETVLSAGTEKEAGLFNI